MKRSLPSSLSHFTLVLTTPTLYACRSVGRSVYGDDGRLGVASPAKSPSYVTH